MSDKQKEILKQLNDAVPQLDEFGQGYLLGKAEGMAYQKERNAAQTEDSEEEK